MINQIPHSIANRILLFIAIMMSPVLCTNAQEHFDAPKDTEFFNLHSEQTGRDYCILVNLPGSYSDIPEKYYPVL